MNRNAKSLQRKAKKHTVESLGRAKFSVTSATSGNGYTVTALANGGYACTCKWAEYRRTDGQPCSHCLSVIEWQEQETGRSTSTWGSKADARRQHRTTERVGLGLWLTTRKARS